MIYRFDFIVPTKLNINCVEDPLNICIFHQLKVSLNLGMFSDS